MKKNEPKSTTQYIHRSAGNPYLPLWEHTPDGEPRVFEDPDNEGEYRIYVYCSHDVRARGYCGCDTRVWSASVDDLTEWRDDGPVFAYEVNAHWDVMFAPDLVEVKQKDGTKEYYLYPNSCGEGRRSMVAKSDRPDGPFEAINMTADGAEVLPDSPMGFDPAVWVEYITDPSDPDFDTGFRAYGYWGFKKSFACELDQDTLYSIRPGTEVIFPFTPSAHGYGEICEPEGTAYPHLFADQDPTDFNFFEAASIRKVGNKYLFIFSGFSGPDYGVTSGNGTLRYAYGDTPLGPWKSGGVLVDCRAIVPNHDGTQLEPTFAAGNTHGSIELINDQYYVFYHRNPGERRFSRQAMVAPISIEWDEAMVSEGGTVSISGYDPYSPKSVWSAEDSQGNHYNGAEVTSEGFYIYGLNPYQYYSAGYACYLSRQENLQDSYDIWDNHMPITEVGDGMIAGYKYFGFGGCDQNTNGPKAFAGTAPGNNTAFNLFLAPKTDQAFKVNVWIDGPWSNEAWNGKMIGTIDVPANAAQEITRFRLDVASFVDDLEAKHALFLVVEGPESDTLCDVIGLGFSSDKTEITRPVVPTVSINVNGEAIDLPVTPVSATGDNGIVDYDLYETTHTIAAGTSERPRVSASASDARLNVTVAQAASIDDTAVVTCDLNGVEKTYKILFLSDAKKRSSHENWHSL